MNTDTIYLAMMSRDRVTQTSPWFHWLMSVFMVLLAVSTALLTVHSVRLEARLKSEQVRVSGIAEWLAQTGTNFERLQALEARIRASRRVIADATESIVFLQGAYSFVHPESGKPLRFVGVRPDGQPLRNAAGQPFISPEGMGPVAEKFFTGTAFVASDDGLLMTNRHVAAPWEFDDAAQALMKQGFVPVLHRFVGYLADVEEPFDVELVVASDEADVAVLRSSGVLARTRSLTLSEASAQPGDDVIVLGYPTGMRALLARADEALVNQITSADDVDFWTVARRLSKEGRIAPLATRGIVGQVTATTVVYDAATTSGGSGGPVIDVNGNVVAINSAILTDFNGSNLGVPAEQARKLLMAAKREEQSGD